MTARFAKPAPRATRAQELLDRCVPSTGLGELPDQAWLIDRLVPLGGVTFLYGKSGSGKTFVAIDLAAWVSEAYWAPPWAFGYFDSKPTWQGRALSAADSVWYFSGEGVAGLKTRFGAWYQHNGHHGLARVNVLPDVPDLTDPAMVEELTTTMIKHDVKVVVIDTLARATVGLEENSAKDMGVAMAALKRIADATGAAVIVVHHTGKSGGYRGSSAIEAAADAMILVEKVTPLTLDLKATKVKEAEPDSFTIDLMAVGDTLVVKPTTTARTTSEAGDFMLKYERAILEFFAGQAIDNDPMPRGAISTGTGIPQRTLIRALNSMLVNEQLERIGAGPSTRYRLTKTGRARAGMPRVTEHDLEALVSEGDR